MITTLIDYSNVDFFANVLSGWRDVDDPDLIFIGVMDEAFQAVGALVVHEHDGRLHIKHIGVDKEHVRAGYGSYLLSECIRIGKRTGEVSLSAELPVREEETEGEKAVRAFFEKNGFRIEDTGIRRKIYSLSDVLKTEFGAEKEIFSKSYAELGEQEKEIVSGITWLPEFQGGHDNISRFVFRGAALEGAAFFRVSYSRVCLEMIIGAKLPVLSSIFESVRAELQKEQQEGNISADAEFVIDYLDEHLERSMEQKFSLQAAGRYRMMMAELKL